MTKSERAEKIEQAAKLLAEVAATLDRKVTNCESCGGYEYENKAHYQMGKEIDAMVRKCEDFARKFRLGLDIWQR